MYLCRGVLTARGDIQNVGGELLKQFIHRCAIQKDAGIEVNPLGFTFRQIAIR